MTIAGSVALAGCTTSTPPDPSPSAAAPTTLDELATALVDDGVVRSASLTIREASAVEPETLSILVQGLEESTPEEMVAMLAEVQEGIDGVLDDRPARTQIQLSTLRADERYASVDMQLDLGRDVLLELLVIATGTACADVATSTVEEFAYVDGDDELAGVSANVATLRCAVEADDAVALAATYDEITAIAPTSSVIARTRWRIEPLAVAPGSPQGDAAELRLDAGPIDGRQQLLVDLMTLAEDAGAEQAYVEDFGDRVDVGGRLPLDQAPVCDVLLERLRAVPDLDIRTVAFDDSAVPDEYFDVCFLQE
ncbi:hypothetical protein [Agrococcus versicolor]|uniref:hypothetical protein n=1 Tax=Agrococcus versicolor TaxID=501482 RepID=UPI0031D2F761